MTQINLKDSYAVKSCIEVSDEVAEYLKQCQRDDEAYRIRTLRAKAYYSLDRNDGIENEFAMTISSPEELYIRKLALDQLDEALASLPAKQGQRVYAHYILGLSKTAIARREGVDERAVRYAIKRGMRNLEIYFKKIY